MAKKRALLAFLVAPSWVPVLMALAASVISALSGHPDWRFVLWLVGISTVLSYGGTFLLGLPAFLVLLARHRTAFWHAPLVGLAAAWITLFVFLTIFFPIIVGGWEAFSLRDAIHILLSSGDPIEMLILLMCSGIPGVLVGSTFWFIVRPDREPR